jgi:hypothetical protein
MISPAKERAIRADLAAGLGFRRIMARHSVGTSVIQRIKAELAAEAEVATSKEEQAE